MKLRLAILAACAATLALTSDFAHAVNDPIPGIDIIVRKQPGGSAIKVGDCQAGGGKVIKQGTQWVCTGLPQPTKQKAPSR